MIKKRLVDKRWKALKKKPHLTTHHGLIKGVSGI